jgi:rfaE bifunctional protein nucleotidyltransferase chain/domain
LFAWLCEDALGDSQLAQLITQDELIFRRRDWKGNGQCVVFVSGCFDLLHPGHIRLLEQARSYGDILVVAIQSDASVRAEDTAKGATESPARPITPAAERAEILAALAAVDYVVEFDEPSSAGLLARLAPDIIVQAGPADSGPAGVPSFAGGAAPKVVRILLEPGYSTARLIERIKQLPA